MFEYTLTIEEIKAVEFARGKYQWADIVYINLDGLKLTLDNMTAHELMELVSIEGIPLLDDRCDLYCFLVSIEPV